MKPANIDTVVERFERTREVCAFAIPDPSYGQNVAMAVVGTGRAGNSPEKYRAATGLDNGS